MTGQWWDRLSDAELSARLHQRGWSLADVDVAIRDRDDVEAVRAQIGDALLR